MATEVLPDDRALRFGRRERALAQMEAHDLDVLVLGRQANARYISGVPQLWVAGTRPFGPICVIVRATGEIHLNSTWDEGVPGEISRERLYGLAWNPRNLIAVLQRIEGADSARRVGTDALTPAFASMLPMAFPRAQLVDAEPAMRAARRIKTPDEVAAIRTAVDVAQQGVQAGVNELRVGVSVSSLAGAVLEAMAAGGVCTPATQDAAWISSRSRPFRSSSMGVSIRPGDLVSLSAGALAGGYVGEVARTVAAADDPSIHRLYQRSEELRERLIAACRPGAYGHELIAAYDAANEPLPPAPIAHGVGMGFDPPVITTQLPRAVTDECLEAGTVLAVSSYVFEHGIGTVFTRDVVLINDGGPELQTTGS